MLDVQIRKRLATGRKRGDSFSLDVSLHKGICHMAKAEQPLL